MSASDAPSALDKDLVREFVANAHGDLGAVREALDLHPTLVNAWWDWGGGDWETALGAASHVGRRDIAELLLGRGARLDVFAAAMLGELDVVRAVLSAHPEALHALGRTASRSALTRKQVASRARRVLELLDASA